MRRVALAGVLLLASGLRAWPLLAGELVWHPDEMFMVAYPLNMLSGDLNPHSFSYPGFHYYLLALIYSLQFLVSLVLDGTSLLHWVAEHYLWNSEALRDTARWVSVGYGTATVWIAAMIARRLCRGEPTAATTTGIIAALLIAINVVHIRQSPLAGTDAAQAFWFALATWAAIRLLDHSRLQDYLVAGLAVGICGATKYPGAAAGAAVIAAHLISRRSVLDRKVWLSGAVAIGAFLCLSPYTLLDLSRFTQEFGFQVAHAAGGRWGEQTSPFFHLTRALLYGSGWAGWVLWILGSAWALWKRPPAHLVLLVAMAAGYVAVSWGNLVFARYMLPLLALQSALIAHAVVVLAGYISRSTPRLRSRWILTGCLLLVVTQPLHGAFSVSQLLAQPDTRTEARNWVEANVTSGSVCCNFGGWGGDVQLQTHHELWWRLTTYLKAFGKPGLTAAVDGASRDTSTVHFVTYEVPADSPIAPGQLKLIRERECSHVFLHQHPLPYSVLDEEFVRGLAQEGTRVFGSDPGSLDGSVYDRMDAYYVPLRGFSITRPGPQIDVWRVGPEPTHSTQNSAPRKSTKSQALSRALTVEASNLHKDSQNRAARDCLKLALRLDADNHHAYRVQARIEVAAGDVPSAVAAYEQAARSGDRIAMRALAQLLASQGTHDTAISWYEKVRAGAPRDGANLNNLAISLWALDQRAEAIGRFEEAIELQPREHWRWFNLGWSFYRSGDMARSLQYLNRATELAPDTLRYLDITAHANSVVGNDESAIDLWTARLKRGPPHGQSHFNLAFTYHYKLEDGQRALPHWKKARQLLPNNPDVVLNGARLLQALGKRNEAINWLREFLQRHPKHASSQNIRDAAARLTAGATVSP